MSNRQQEFPAINGQEQKPKNKSNPQEKVKKSEMNFLDRNYYPALMKAKNQSGYHWMNENELSSLYFVMKKYYNEILNENEKNSKKNKDISKRNHELEEKINNIEKSKEVTINGKESINVVEAYHNVDKIITRIEKLQNEKGDIKSRFTNESEYSTTINYMISNEQNNLKKLKEEILVLEERRRNIQASKKNLIENHLAKDAQRHHSQALYLSIQDEIQKYQQLMYEQEIQKEKETAETEEKERKVEILRERIEEEKVIAKEEIKNQKEETLNAISLYNYKKKEKERKEYEYVSFVLGLHFFQKNFIEVNKKGIEIDTKKIRQSEEYKLYFEIPDKRKGEPKKKKEKLQQKEVDLDELKKKFDELTLHYSDIYEYYIKLVARDNSTRSKLMSLNQRQIELESKKEKYSKRVKEIISKDYQNFEDLVSENARFKEFLEKKEPEIYKSKYLLVQKKKEEMAKLLTENDYHPDLKDILKKSKLFLCECEKAKNEIALYIDGMDKIIRRCGGFREVDDTTVESKNYDQGSSKGDIRSLPGIPLSEKFRTSSVEALNRYENTKKRDFLYDMLFYAEANRIEDSNLIFDTLFSTPNTEANVKNFIRKNPLVEKFVFYFFKEADERRSMIEVIEKIRKYYKDTTSKSTKNTNLSIKTKPSKTGIQFDEKVPYTECKNKQDKDYKESYPGTTKNKSYQGGKHFVFKSQNSISENDNTKVSSNLDNEIKKEYNYEFSDSSDEDTRNTRRPLTSNASKKKRKKSSNNLYDETLEKTLYLRTLNSGMRPIKNDTSKARYSDFFIRRTWRDIDEYKHQFLIYNNPRINVNSLSNDTYKFIATQMLEISNGQAKATKGGRKNFLIKSNQ